MESLKSGPSLLIQAEKSSEEFSTITGPQKRALRVGYVGKGFDSNSYFILK